MKKMVVVLMETHLPLFRNQFFMICAEIATHYQAEAESAHLGLPYLWKYLTAFSKVGQSEAMYGKFNLFTRKLVAIQSPRMANKFVQKYLYQIPFAKAATKAIKMQAEIK